MSKRSCEAAESIEDASLRMARVNGRRMQKRSVRIALRRKGRMSLSRPDGAYCFLHRAVPFSLQCAFRMIKYKERDYSREVFYTRSGDETSVEYKSRTLVLNQLKPAHRDSKGTKVRA